jgi:hypothetical protein
LSRDARDTQGGDDGGSLRAFDRDCELKAELNAILAVYTDVLFLIRASTTVRARLHSGGGAREKEKMPELRPKGTFSWPELATTDQKAGVAFYRSLFGWDVNEQPIGPTEMFDVSDAGERGRGRVHDASRGTADRRTAALERVRHG